MSVVLDAEWFLLYLIFTYSILGFNSDAIRYGSALIYLPLILHEKFKFAYISQFTLSYLLSVPTAGIEHDNLLSVNVMQIDN